MPLNLAFQAGVQLGLEVPSELRLWESPGSGQHKGRSVWSLVLPTLSTTQCHPPSVLFPTHQEEALPDPESCGLLLRSPDICFVLGVSGGSSACTMQLDLLM